MPRCTFSTAGACGSSPAPGREQPRFKGAWRRPSARQRSYVEEAASRSYGRQRRRNETVRSSPNVARTRLRPVRIEDAFPLVPLFEAFYGTYFGEAVTETAIRRRLRQAEGHETVVVAEGGDRLGGFASLRGTPPLELAPHAGLTGGVVASGVLRARLASKIGE